MFYYQKNKQNCQERDRRKSETHTEKGHIKLN